MTAPDARRPDRSTAAPAGRHGRPETVLDGLLAQLAADTASEEASFAEVLRGRLTELEAPPAAPATAAPPAAPATPRQAPSPASVDVRPDALPSPALDAPVVQWSAANLLRLGLPPALVDGLRGLDPRDDTAWVAGIAAAVGTLTRPLPAAAAVYVGPDADRLAGAMGLDLVEPGSLAPDDRAFAVAAVADARTQSWLAWSRGRRWLHLVIGGDGWRPYLFDEPFAVSWVGDDQLCEAVRLSTELGLVLGYGLASSGGEQVRRATPLEVALAIRDLLPRR